MTCIVGVAKGGRVYMGADSAGSNGSIIVHRSDDKIFRNGEMIIGFTSSFRMGQILRYCFTPPKIPKKSELLDKYMSLDFVDQIRTTFKEKGYARSQENADVGGTFLVGVRGRLFKIDTDFQVGENGGHLDACGSGEDFAYGSLFSTSTFGAPMSRVRHALEAAAFYCPSVRGPFKYMSSEK